MGLKLNDSTVEEALIRLAQKQPIPSTKHGIAIAILRRALRDGIEEANAWLHNDNAHCGASDSGG